MRGHLQVDDDNELSTARRAASLISLVFSSKRAKACGDMESAGFRGGPGSFSKAAAGMGLPRLSTNSLAITGIYARRRSFANLMCSESKGI